MGEKITLQDIVDLLVQKQNITKKDAEVFVRAVFDLIEELLEREKCVKVKGLGQFKLIKVESRESINVNTGERFEIQGHSKISFTPEATVRDLINKPFAHFEAVPLNDDFVLEDTLETADSFMDEVNEDLEILVEDADNSDILPKGHSTIIQRDLKSIDKKDDKCDIEIEVDRGEKGDFESGKNVDFHLVVEKEQLKSETKKEIDNNVLDEGKQEIKVRKGWYFVFILLAVLVFIGYQFYKIRESDSSSKDLIKSQKQSLQETVQQIHLKDTCLQDSIQSNLFMEKGMPEKDSIKGNQIDKAEVIFSSKNDYEIIGVLQDHTISSGETLRKISLKYYGTKDLSSYIVLFNSDVIKDPNNVSVGVVIKIPQLRRK